MMNDEPRLSLSWMLPGEGTKRTNSRQGEKEGGGTRCNKILPVRRKMISCGVVVSGNSGGGGHVFDVYVVMIMVVVVTCTRTS